MKAFGKAVTLIAVSIVVLGGTVLMMWSETYDKAVALKNSAPAQEESNKNSWSNVIVVLKEKAGVYNVSFDKAAELDIALAHARYDKGASLAKFITENGGTADLSLAQDLSRAIESKMDEFKRNQDKLIDIEREYNTLREGFFSRFVVGHFPDLDVTIVLNKKAAADFATGEMSDLDLMKQNKAEQPQG